MRARFALVLALAMVASAAAPTVGASALADPTVDADGARVDSGAGSATHPAGASNPTVPDGSLGGTDGGTITEVITLHRLPDDPGAVEVTLSYRIPDDVTELEVESRFLSYDDVTVASTDGFDRRSVRRFVWDGATDAATITLEVQVATDSFARDDVGVATDDWAFSYLPNPYVNWRYRDDPPAFDTTHTVASEGHATSAFGIVGNASTRTGSVGDATLTLVVPDDARPRSSFDELVDLYRVGERELDAGFSYENATVFVLPTRVFERRSAVGTTVAYSVWLQDEYSAIEGVENTPAHEYVHTRMGTFRGVTGRWLTEASAEYYGALLSMNSETGNWTSFRASLEVERQSVRQSTLTRPRSWPDAYVPYSKGSRVLAALDAEIRERTDGERSLQDVLAYRFEDDDRYGNLDTYDGLVDAVVAVTDDPEMHNWLDRYVAGDEVPPLPDDPDRFVMNESMDSDGDGVVNGREVETNPFDPDSDDDGVDDGEDAYPTDPSRSAAADEPNTSAVEPTTAMQTMDDRTTTESTKTTSATSSGGETEPARTASTTSEPTASSATDSSDDSPTSTTVTRTISTTSAVTNVAGTNGEDGSDANGETPGFGLTAPVVTLAALALLGRRRQRD